MALLERVSTLVRANLNDLIDRAEHPEKMIKQIMLDMENQLMQVKTQVAIAIADEHLLLKKQKENEEKAAEWTRKAEIAVDKKQDDLARAANGGGAHRRAPGLGRRRGRSRLRRLNGRRRRDAGGQGRHRPRAARVRPELTNCRGLVARLGSQLPRAVI